MKKLFTKKKLKKTVDYVCIQQEYPKIVIIF